MLNNHLPSASKFLSCVALALVLVTAPVAANTEIIIVVADGPGEGFNDPTPAAPVGGNFGATVGEQRLIAFQYAAEIWGANIESPIPIRIQSSFDPLACSPTSAVLGSAGATSVFANFPGAEFSLTWYPSALADKISGIELSQGNPDLLARFNSNLGQPTCLAGSPWYYGLDRNAGTGVDLVAVLLHEFAHGLGFANFVNEANGTSPLGLTDVFSQYSRDNTTGKSWAQMDNSERVASAINFRKVVWDGRNVSDAAPDVLSPGTPILRILAPPQIADDYAVAPAAFGPPLTSAGAAGDLVLADDGADPTADGCSPLLNNMAGKIALIDRGLCSFTIKVAHAQAAGAIGVVIANNVVGTPPALGGADPTIVIPSVSISLADGNRIKAELASGVTGNMLYDLGILSGADAEGRLLLFTPNPLQSGSSMSHWDSLTFPNQLMEPSINRDLTHELTPPFDLTHPLMVDIGWFTDRDGVPDGRDRCLGSDVRSTIIFDECDSGVPNPIRLDGCSAKDELLACAEEAANHGQFTSCVSRKTNQWERAGLLSRNQKGAIQACAARASLP